MPQDERCQLLTQAVRWTDGALARGREAAAGEAALALFAEHGFAATTVDEVAAAAGVTQRTFFRHFRDKEEVLFGGDEQILQVLLAGLADGGGPDPAADLLAALLALAGEFEPQRDHLRLRASVIAADVGLTGRDLAKQARWTAAVADGLREKGHPPDRAHLVAEVGSAVFRHAVSGGSPNPPAPRCRSVSGAPCTRRAGPSAPDRLRPGSGPPGRHGPELDEAGVGAGG
jgi:AcrR family transcriptional regulator